MAFTYCSGCGEKIDDSVSCCPHCGQAKGEKRREASRNNENTYSSQSSYGGYDQNNYGQNEYGQNSGGYGGYGRNTYGRGDYGGGCQPWVTPGYNYAPKNDGKKRKISIGHLIFSILSIFFSPLFGVIALYNVIIAAQQPNDELEESKKRNCIIFCTIGICIGCLANVLVAWMTFNGYGIV